MPDSGIIAAVAAKQDGDYNSAPLNFKPVVFISILRKLMEKLIRTDV